MKVTEAAATQTARHAAQRILAIRADIASVEASTVRARETMLRALKRDLFEQECKLHDALVGGAS